MIADRCHFARLKRLFAVGDVSAGFVVVTKIFVSAGFEFFRSMERVATGVEFSRAETWVFASIKSFWSARRVTAMFAWAARIFLFPVVARFISFRLTYWACSNIEAFGAAVDSGVHFENGSANRASA